MNPPGTRLLDVGYARVPMKVIGKGRPRFSRGKAHTDPKTREAERLIVEAWEHDNERNPEWTGPISVRVTSHMASSKHSNKYKVGGQCTKSPDGDNILKLVCDALNEVAYKDDRQAIYQGIYKAPFMAYGSEEYLEIEVDYLEVIDGRN